MAAIDTLRLLLADVDPDRQTLTDSHLTGFLKLQGIAQPQAEDGEPWQIRYAAADALDAIATSEALVGKVIRSQDLTTDGTKVAAELRAQAANHRARGDEAREAAADATGDALTVIEFHPWP